MASLLVGATVWHDQENDTHPQQKKSDQPEQMLLYWGALSVTFLIDTYFFIFNSIFIFM